jgi:hypothetical protein
MKIGIALLTFCLAAASAAAETLPLLTNAPATAFSRDVHAAARFATRDRQVKIVRIQSADIQEIAGTSFRLCLAVRTDMKRFRAAAIISRSLSGRLSLTQWNPGGC